MANQHQTTGHTAGKLCGGLWGERNEVLNIRMEEGSWWKVQLSWAQAPGNLVEQVCGVGRAYSGDRDAALPALVCGSPFGNHWPEGELPSATVTKTHFG